ncbi:MULTISPECIES: hypothetical protein [Actinoplanes]|uniref:hypothetical protein n=1 Tax=Actinoplanes TaxID=1865 RepID=UPI0005F2F6D2|nr:MULTISPECIES: hypothetical protein [Actinoplanes]GLY02793.1 hypothetical protein Acsp01_31720 [Actinoplanes sp. NBRC 101535]
MSGHRDATPAGVNLVVDIDETLLNPLPRWAERVNRRFGWDIASSQVEPAGGWDNYLAAHPDYPAFSVFADTLRADPEFNSGLDPIDGAVEALTSLGDLPGVRVGCYLTTRPAPVAAATAADLRRLGFPVAPVVARPESVDRARTVDWKTGELERLLTTGPGQVIVIDDNLALGRRLCERNAHAATPIVGIVFLGPLTHTEVRKRGIVSCPEHHFYVADWKETVTIVKSYA